MASTPAFAEFVRGATIVVVTIGIFTEVAVAIALVENKVGREPRARPKVERTRADHIHHSL